MKFQRFPSVVIALCLGLVLPAGGLIAQGDSQAVSQFLANPTQALQQYPNGGAQLISLMRDVAVAHPEALSTIMSALSSANTDQQAAIGSGLGQAAQISVRTDQAYANQIQQALASSNSDAAKTAFAGVTGDTTIGAAGGGGGGGGGGGVRGPVNSGLPTGGGGSGGGSTGGGFSNGHSGLTGGSGGPGGSGGNGSTQLLTGGGTGGLSSSLTTDQGEFSASGGIATINVSGGTVTVNVLTGQLTFTNKSNQSSTVSAGDTAQFEGGAVTQLMATTDALKSNNSAFAQVTQQSL
ncbi:MAG TPA: hypothetical protein VG710_07115, partial [Opitutus sp.]|nr:hypothetical protein [Opitutus sp.]